MNPALLLMGLLSGSPAQASETGRPELGRHDDAGAMLAVPKTWLIATQATEDGGVAEVRESQKRLSPVVMMQWGAAAGRSVDQVVDERVTKLGTEMAIGTATESKREDFGEGGRRATLEAGMMGVAVPIIVAARIVDDRYLVAVFTGPPSTHTALDAPAMVEEMLSRSIWSGELPPL
ncbi:MAG: hypothetical protein KC912_18250 [Proteobacteria bacterium]|nr:hypothetical protein [Pseudomonadota bacterium]